MLGICAIPGIYVEKDSGRLFVADHLEAALLRGEDGGLQLRITNPTPCDADTSVYAEDARGANGVLSALSPPEFARIRVPAGQTVVVPWILQRR